jgi:hypothetical protein
MSCSLLCVVDGVGNINFVMVTRAQYDDSDDQTKKINEIYVV